MALDPLTRLINREHTISADYVPPDLVRACELNFSGVLTLKSDDIKADRTAMAALDEMLCAASGDGVDGFYLVSVYRTYEHQQRLWDKKVANDPEYGADPRVPIVTALPGASEHQTGLAFDIAAVDARALSASFAETVQGQWLYAHCHEYGFILRYPDDKQDITCIVFEPWHFRYVGKELSMYLYENNMVLEEFYSY